MDSKCDCQNCGGHIAFSTEQAGQNVVCPHCGKETLVDAPPQPANKFFVWQDEQQQEPFGQETIELMISEGQITGDTLLCPEDGGVEWTPAKGLFLQDVVPESLAPTNLDNPSHGTVSAFPGSQAETPDDGSRLEIRMDSGAELRIEAVRLYDEISLAEINSQRTEALKKLQGVSTGIGAIGSIGWVLATSVVIGAVEGVLSSGLAFSGANQLADVIKMEQHLRSKGVFLRVGKIENIETPIPGLWRVGYKRKAQVHSGVTFLGEKKYELRDVNSAFIHSGDEFVVVGTEDGSTCSIRWSAVERYAYRR
jgi:hypothetical protein